MKGTKEITICDTPNCGEEALDKCDSCGGDICYKHAWQVGKPVAMGGLNFMGDFSHIMYACASCLAPILGQRVETKGVAK